MLLKTVEFQMFWAKFARFVRQADTIDKKLLNIKIKNLVENDEVYLGKENIARLLDELKEVTDTEKIKPIESIQDIKECIDSTDDLGSYSFRFLQ